MNYQQNETILIIDDNPNNLAVLYEALERASYRVLVEMDGKSGIEQVKNNPPDLILLDVMMQGMDGFETCRQLQEDTQTQEIPIIFMTALDDVSDRVKGLSLGAVDYITKPFQQEEVLARIRVHLKIRRLKLELAQEKQQLEVRVEERSRELKQVQLQLVQQEKLSAIGQLVTGVAHEMNNPLGFLAGNLLQVNQGLQDLIDYVNLCQKKYFKSEPEMQQKAAEIELEYLLEDLPPMLKSMQTGCDRLRDISNSLRTFSRADSTRKVRADIHEGIDSTLMLLKHRLKPQDNRPEIQIKKHYSELPQIECYLGQLNQVFMNIISNAIDAIEECNNAQTSNCQLPIICIKTCSVELDWIAIHITDNGKGIPATIQEKLFDPFFTTKAVGKGTGLGLSISHQIVSETHGGYLSCHSAPNRGTEFTIKLPVR